MFLAPSVCALGTAPAPRVATRYFDRGQEILRAARFVQLQATPWPQMVAMSPLAPAMEMEFGFRLALDLVVVPSISSRRTAQTRVEMYRFKQDHRRPLRDGQYLCLCRQALD